MARLDDRIAVSALTQPPRMDRLDAHLEQLVFTFLTSRSLDLVLELDDWLKVGVVLHGFNWVQTTSKTRPGERP